MSVFKSKEDESIHDSSPDLKEEEEEEKEVLDVSEKNPQDDEENEEEQWTSRWSFILAAIGSAIGLGNFWRFPFLVFRYGGGSFFIPYIIAIIVVGVPLLQLEMAMGQVHRKAMTGAFAMLHDRARGLGLTAAAIAFGINGYYCVLLGYGNVMWVQSWLPDMPWSIRGLNGTDVIDVPSDAFDEMLQISDSPSETSVISSLVFAGAFFQWFTVFLVLYKGQEFISRIVWFTVLAPVFMLLVLVIVGSTLDGAGDGVKAYIGEWDMSNLSDGQMWADAFGQVFFSLSLSTGCMTAFASMNPRNQNVIQDAVIVAVSNSMFSFISGFAVFTVAGYLSKTSGIPLEDLPLSGPSLAFIAFPSGLSLLKGYWANILTVWFFTVFYFLGLDSAFALLESVYYNFREVAQLKNISRENMMMVICALGFLTTILYCADIGFYLLDFADFYVGTFGLIVVGWLECVFAGWSFRREVVAEKVGSSALVTFEASVCGGFVIFSLLQLTLSLDNTAAIFGVSIGVGLGIMLIGGLTSVWLAVSAKNIDAREALYYLAIFAPISLKDELNRTITENGTNPNWSFSTLWAVSLKFIMTPVMTFLLCNQVVSLSKNGGIYTSSYDELYLQLFGVALFCMVGSFFVIGFFAPNVYVIDKVDLKRASVDDTRSSVSSADELTQV